MGWGFVVVVVGFVVVVVGYCRHAPNQKVLNVCLWVCVGSRLGYVETTMAHPSSKNCVGE